MKSESVKYAIRYRNGAAESLTDIKSSGLRSGLLFQQTPNGERQYPPLVTVHNHSKHRLGFLTKDEWFLLYSSILHSLTLCNGFIMIIPSSHLQKIAWQIGWEVGNTVGSSSSSVNHRLAPKSEYVWNGLGMRVFTGRNR